MRAELVPLTVPEIRHLLWQVPDPTDPRALGIFAWSRWRRHQAIARRCHYQRRLALIRTELQLQ